jgi:hypothetical protein
MLVRIAVSSSSAQISIGAGGGGGSLGPLSSHAVQLHLVFAQTA